MKPFLKWAGGKYRLLPHIRRRLPAGRRLIEPFVGSGAVFLNTDYPEYILADINADVISLYQVLQEYGNEFIAYCKSMFIPENNTPERYYVLRAEFNDTDDRLHRAALFVYLNRHGYNGLCRYNRNGRFNVPFGRYQKPYFPEQEMQYFAQKATRATFVCDDFRNVMARAVPGDVMYCDPPYVPLSRTANFRSYAANGFTWEEQEDLARLAKELSQKGIPVLISNHATEFTLAAYAAAQQERIEVRRVISCDGANRATATEVLALFCDLAGYTQLDR
ncbi:DNA adenine methylase Dam [Alicyclobacillus sacchari]|uniref:Site-specific DNA-methyltransferase (adenine-specific) n=1 Tax=Alicyclobacillus sacchari TaxID=392010 RepID=A0A4V3HE95_9BACL|nr:Dam family site-specific DNA-(adenine-N6)-methyltransferase [Alicyclobacillus sacchari]TDY45325.1 DNA adenine methylase Dam [Alicyclobacillus sacchari]GMA56959.1 site-specific DNA-methyltransferase (adenine-specific) [Alicyclobacillus sacchari]